MKIFEIMEQVILIVIDIMLVALIAFGISFMVNDGTWLNYLFIAICVIAFALAGIMFAYILRNLITIIKKKQ